MFRINVSPKRQMRHCCFKSASHALELWMQGLSTNADTYASRLDLASHVNLYRLISADAFSQIGATSVAEDCNKYLAQRIGGHSAEASEDSYSQMRSSYLREYLEELA